MGRWTLDDIPWQRFDGAKVDPELLRVVKAASVVEQNGADYADYLCGVFAGDREFQDAARRWGAEEAQHGLALGRWASLADPAFDYDAACARFTAGYRVKRDASASVRGSRAGELVARCIVETATSSYYTAMGEAAAEPVLQAICRRIAADEIRHYRLFHLHLERYLASEGLGVWRRLGVALGRIAETEDDELAYAYHAANEPARVYDRSRAAREHGRRAFALYRRHHVERGIALIFKAVGLKRTGRLDRVAASLAWWGLKRRVARWQRQAAS
ncbi:MAG TPA: ferritin-like domain-containing protein [Stellaceae bacterium]|nr:ferritin-like domain-containing protein [Stellaceae bacterium]